MVSSRDRDGARGDTEPRLREILAGRPPGDLRIGYSDLHGLWGGVAVQLGGAGDWERTTRERGGEPVTIRRTVAVDGVRAVVRLLVEIEAWEQRIPDAMPLPDESRATLTIRCGGAESAMWERYHDLAATGRLARVRDALLRLGGE